MTQRYEIFQSIFQDADGPSTPICPACGETCFVYEDEDNWGRTYWRSQCCDADMDTDR